MWLLSKRKKIKKINATNRNTLNKLEKITNKTNRALIAPSVTNMPFSCDIFSFTTLPTLHIYGYTQTMNFTCSKKIIRIYMMVSSLIVRQY